jgi:hypothetical protein
MLIEEIIRIKGRSDIESRERIPKRGLNISLDGFNFGGIGANGSKDVFNVFGSKGSKNFFNIIRIEITFGKPKRFFG